MGLALKWEALALIGVTCFATLAQAERGDPMARARTHCEAGRALYNLQNYSDAIREFTAAYELVAKPELLLNLGQCYRKLDKLEQAREMYSQYLSATTASDSERA